MSAYLPAKRPLTVTLILWGVILFGIWNLGRAVTLYQQLDVLLTLNIILDPRIRLVMACGWMMIFFWLARAVWKKKPYSLIAIPIVLVCYALNDFFLQQFAPIATNLNGLMRSLFFIAIIILIYGMLNRPQTKQYFTTELLDEEV